MGKRDHKRQVEIEKSREEFRIRLELQKWREAEKAEALFRLVALSQFAPGKSDRQIWNHTKINLN